MRSQEKPSPPNTDKPLRTSAIARTRESRKATYVHRRRRAGTIRMDAGTAAIAPPVSLARQFWDDHAIKAGMGVFWAWFVIANWSNLQQVGSEWARAILG